MNLDSVWVVEWSKVDPRVIGGIEEGTIKLWDGVAYWAKDSGKTGIVQHLPFVQTDITQTEALLGSAKALQAAQITTVAAVGASTALIMGAILVQTIYLSRKLDAIQSSIDLVSQDVHSQNILYFMERLTDYFGAVESARVILLDRDVAEEARELAIVLLADLATKRNQLLSFIDNVLNVTSQLSDRHYGLVLDFLTLVLDLVPKGMHIEMTLYARIGKVGLGEHTLLQARKQYERVLNNYREWFNEQFRLSVKGQLADRRQSFDKQLPRVEALVASEENRLLLGLPHNTAADRWVADAS